MNKIQKLFKASSLLLRKPYLINKIIDDNDEWLRRVEDDFGISSLPEVKYQDLSKAEEIIVKPFAFLEGGSLPTDLALLRILASGFDRCRYFEIGTWRGESAANVSDVAEECTTMNLSVNEMQEMGLDESYIGQHAMYSRGISNIEHLEGNSLIFDFAGLNKKYDLIFIDGDHHYASIKKDTENVFKHLVHENSVVVWHDYAWQPANLRFETMAAILAGVPEQFHKKLYAVRNTLCAMYFPGEIKSHQASAIAIKEEAFEVKVKNS